jgi:hypothetical protein
MIIVFQCQTFLQTLKNGKNAHLISIDYSVDPLLNHGLKTDATAQSLCEKKTKEKSLRQQRT